MQKSQPKSLMKGLTQFIVDLRNSKDQDEEDKKIHLEINNIRSKFKSNLNGYQKKKYVCKLIYIYLLGNHGIVDFGLKEAFELFRSNVYSEKKLGYLAVSVLLDNENSTSKLKKVSCKEHLNYVLEEVQPDLVRDLQSENEEYNCLAIEFIASCFNVGDSDVVVVKESDPNFQEWLELIDMVYSAVTSPISKLMVKRKGSLALKSLLRLYPEVIITNSNWVPRLLKLIDEKDFANVISCIPLLQDILTLNTQYVKAVVPGVARKLSLIVIDGVCPPVDYYYDSPAPWLIVKLLQFVEQLFLLVDKQGSQVLTLNQLDENTVNELRQVVAKSIQNASQPIKGLPNRNSQSSILFQAVSLAVFLEASPDAIHGAMNALVMLLNSAETNTRYLSLDALIKLTARSNSTYLSSKDKFDETLAVIMKLLRDKDISVRRKALDLIYTLCTFDNYNVIISLLLEYFPTADFQLKSELAIKIAVMAEKFATDSTWYVTTMLKLLSIGGGSNSNGIGFMTNEVWERIVQIVVNNGDLQKKACKLLINLLRRPFNPQQGSQQQQPQPQPQQLSESLVKVASFVLGEYGEQVNDIEDLNVHNQFQILFDAYFKVSLLTRAMLLTTFLKFLVKFPDALFVPNIVDLFEIETQSIDLEIQTRAYEYLKLVTLQSDFALAKNVIKPFPAFDNKIENPLMNRLGSLNRIVGLNRSRSVVMAKNIRSKPDAGVISEEGGDADTTLESNPFGETKAATTSSTNPILSPNWYAGYHRMLHFDAGIFYEDQLIKITYRVIKNTNELTLKFTIINNAQKTIGKKISGFTVLNLESLASIQDPNYTLHIKTIPEPMIADKTQMDIEIKVRNIIENNESPILSMTFTCGGSFNQLNLKFPVLLLKTITPTALATVDDFEKRWQQISQMLGVQQGESIQHAVLTHRHNTSNISRLLARVGLAIVQCSPDSPDTPILVTGAGILHTQKSNYGVLVKVRGTDQIGKELEITVRCTGGGVAEVIAATLKEIFAGKF
ncbi:AP-2 complex subunit alpha [Candida viswanathii]|uniref:AP-2 complex subunit alpha n=1 Tax=Candida viswanathii TaxID=5486 RepID=A0A367YDW4_9ASCO|nr:AP-2 complex subunit alpha [Candida viswanathii]